MSKTSAKKRPTQRSEMTKMQWTWKEMKRNKTAYFMLAPFFILFIIFTVLPVFLSIILSLTTRFGKRVLHEYAWSDVTDVRDNRKVWVGGKLLLTDPSFDDFPEFYRMARAACKGKGKPTPPSEKKQRSRKKNSR